MIGGLLRFAPGRLGARQGHAPSCRGIRWRVVSWLSCVDLGDELDTEARAIGGSRLLVGRDGNRQREAARCVSRGLLKERIGAGWSGLAALMTMVGAGAGLRG